MATIIRFTDRQRFVRYSPRERRFLELALGPTWWKNWAGTRRLKLLLLVHSPAMQADLFAGETKGGA